MSISGRSTPPCDPIFAALDLRRGPQAYALLERVIERCQAERNIVVFDLDSTLLDNKPRQARIMAEYGHEQGVAALTQTRAEHWKSWDFREAMRNAGLPADEVESHVEGYRAVWRARFFTSEYCRIDAAVVGAAAFVQAVRAAGGRVFYVTGRQQSMRAGSEYSLVQLGFAPPNGDQVQLWMKPSIEDDDDQFKAQVHDDLRRLGRPVAMFDNEPSHINGYHRSFPDAMAIHLATDHSMRLNYVDPTIPSIPDFSAWPTP